MKSSKYRSLTFYPAAWIKAIVGEEIETTAETLAFLETGQALEVIAMIV